MADRYWIATGSVKTANTASNWNTAADGSGSTGVPTTNDTVIFGHDDSFTNNLGNAPCRWDLAVTLTRFQSNAQHYKDLSVISSTISFNSTGNVISMGNEGFNPAELGFKVGMEVTITGSTSNNITFLISALDDVSITSASSLTTEAAGNEVTITYSPYIDVNAAVTTTRLDLDTHFKNTGSAIVWDFSGTYPASNTYIFNGDNAKISNKDVITFSINSTGNGTTGMYFTEGPYPKVSLTSGRFTPQAVSTGSTTHAFVEMESLSIGSSVLFQPNGVADLRNDAKKIFKINTTSTISLQCDTFDAGLATFEFVMNTGGAGFEIPCSGSSTYGAADKTFVAKWSGLILSTGSAGFKGYIPTNRTLAVSSIHVKEDASLVPQSTTANSTLVSISRPRVDGAWSFKQLTDGVYVSLMTDAFAVTPSDGPAGRVQLSNDAGAFTSDSTLKYDTSNGELRATKFIGDGSGLTNLPGGGGGSGTVTSVAVTGSDGIEVDSGSPVTTSGTIALGVNKTNMLSHLNVDDGADVTNTANVTAAGALMDSEVTNLAQVKAFDSADYATATQGTTADNALPKAGGTMTGEIEGTTITLNAIPADPATDTKVRLGESGTTSNMLRIQTNDGRIDIGPNNGTFAHIQTDRSQFYFSKPVLVDGGGQVFAYNDGLKLGTGTSASGGTTAITIADGSSDITVAGTTTSTGFIKTGGTSSEFLMADGSVSTGGGGGGSGDVVGPSSATNNNFVAFDGTTGKLVKDSAKGASDFATAAQGVLAASALQPTQAELDVFTPTGISGPFWGGGGPPTTIQEAIERIAAYAAQEISAITGAPPLIP